MSKQVTGVFGPSVMSSSRVCLYRAWSCAKSWCEHQVEPGELLMLREIKRA
jgi:hypothetical protein